MKIVFKNGKQDFYIKQQLMIAIKSFCSLLGISEVDKVEVLDKSYINSLQGATDYTVVNGIPKYRIALDKDIVIKSQVDNKKSNLYNIIYHELSHVQNISILLKHIDINDLPAAYMTTYKNYEDMKYQMGWFLWGEFYAYFQQFKRDSRPLDEHEFLAPILELGTDMIVAYNDIKTKTPKGTDYVNLSVYNALYTLIILLAYCKAVPVFDNSDMVKQINKKLRLDCGEYIHKLEVSFNTYWDKYPNGFNKDIIMEIGAICLEFYALMGITIIFEKKEFLLFYDTTQPILAWYSSYKPEFLD